MNLNDLINSLGATVDLEDFDFERCYKEVKPGGLSVLKANIAHYVIRHNMQINSLEIDKIEIIIRKIMENEQ